MFYDIVLLHPQHKKKLLLPWLAGTTGLRCRFITKQKILDVDIINICATIQEFITSNSTSVKKRFSLRFSAILTNGVVKIFYEKVKILEADVIAALVHKAAIQKAFLESDTPSTPVEKVKRKPTKKKTKIVYEETPEIVVQPIEQPEIITARVDDITIREDQVKPQEQIQEFEDFGMLTEEQMSRIAMPFETHVVVHKPPLSPGQTLQRTELFEPQQDIPSIIPAPTEPLLDEQQLEIPQVAKSPPIRVLGELQQDEVEKRNKGVIERGEVQHEDVPLQPDQAEDRVVPQGAMFPPTDIPKKGKKDKVGISPLLRLNPKTYKYSSVKTMRYLPEKVLEDLYEEEFVVPDLPDDYFRDLEEMFLTPELPQRNKARATLRSSASESVLERVSIPKPTTETPELAVPTPDFSDKGPGPTPTHTGATPKKRRRIVSKEEVSVGGIIETPVLEIQVHRHVETPMEQDLIIPTEQIPVEEVPSATIEEIFIESERQAMVPIIAVNKDIRKQRIIEIVSKWNYEDSNLTLDHICQRMYNSICNKANIAATFGDLLTLCKGSIVKLHSRPDSCELSCITKGLKLL